MERDEGNHHSQDGQGTVKGDLDIAKTDAGLFGKLADKSFSRKHDHIGNYLKADAKCHDNASDDQINKGRTPWTAEAGRDKAHGRINAEAEKECHRNLQSLLDGKFPAKNGFQHQERHIE